MAFMNRLMACLALLICLFPIACARERPVQVVLSQPSRIPKRQLEGTFLFLKSVAAVQSPGPAHRAYAPAMHLISDKLVQFVLHENQIDIVSIDPLYTVETAAPQNQTLASFAVRHVDVVRKRNPDGDDTHEEEVTQDRHLWQQREYAIADLLSDHADPIESEAQSATLTLPFEWDAQREAINFVVQRLLKDGTTLATRYSFLRYRPSASYAQRPYLLEHQLHFGLFRTTAFRVNAFDQFTDSNRQEFLNRWDTSRTIAFRFSPGFPNHLKRIVRRISGEWAALVKEAVGDCVVEIDENTAEQPGDLRYNVIAYDDSEHISHGVLGYAPTMTNPRTGEILKADVVLYGRVLKRALFQELFWEKSRLASPAHPAASAESIAPGILREPLEILRHATLQDLTSKVTRIGEEVVRTALADWRAGVSAEQLEERVFGGVFIHEFGHALGLGHNFNASADTQHFAVGERTSSVMDYGFLQGHANTLGPYDRAAILFAYSPDAVIQEEQLEENFLFCSDEEVFSSRRPLCQQYDSGTTLKQLVHSQLDRYYSNYEVNNLRLDRISFPNDAPTYEQRILSLLLPIRLVYDNAHALLQAYGKKDFAGIWRMAGQRVERGRSSHPEDLVELPVADSTPMVRVLDKRKIERVVLDARAAKQESILALSRVVLDTSRPDLDEPGGVKNRIQVRGVLPDKLMALSLIAAPTQYPLQPGRSLSPYSVAEKWVPKLFASLLSNTSEVQDPQEGPESYYRIQQYDMALRKHALKLLVQEVAQVGRHPEANRLIEIQLLTLPDRTSERGADWEKLKSARQDFRDYYGPLMMLEVRAAGTVAEGDLVFSFADFSPFEHARNQFDYAYTQINVDTLLTAPVSLPIDDIKTASGLLIRNNLNVAEDYLQAINDSLGKLGTEVFGPRKTNKSLSKIDAIKGLDKRRDALRRYLEGEHLFLRDMYLAFSDGM